MSNYKTQAINLKSYNLGESDKIIVMYSRDYGIIRCVAKGVKKPSSKLGGRMQTLIVNELLLAKGRNLDIVCQAQTLESFSKIKQNLDKLSYACYCVELLSIFGTEDDTGSSKIYDNIFETLKNISVFNTTEEIIWAVLRFKLKLAVYLGYAVELDSCVRCNSTDTNYRCFCPESGGVVCKECSGKLHRTFEINEHHIQILKDSLNYDFPFEKEHHNKEILLSNFNILKEFIAHRADKKLKTPELIEILC